MPSQLDARKAIPKSRHQTYLEFVQNKDYKKKPLDFQVAFLSYPNPGDRPFPSFNLILTVLDLTVFP